MHIDRLLKSDQIELIFSQELLLEFIDVAERPKLKIFFNDSDISDLLTSIYKVATLITVSSDVQICRDSKDNFLLGLCKDSKADYLITGDADLLVLEKF